MIEPFKPRLARKYVGTYRPKIDGLEKASGRTKYTDDLTVESSFPGMLYAKFLRSPYPRAKIKRVDTSEAERLPGVKAIITYADPYVASLPPTTLAWTDGTCTIDYAHMWFPHTEIAAFLATTCVGWVMRQAWLWLLKAKKLLRRP